MRYRIPYKISHFKSHYVTYKLNQSKYKSKKNYMRDQIQSIKFQNYLILNGQIFSFYLYNIVAISVGFKIKYKKLLLITIISII